MQTPIKRKPIADLKTAIEMYYLNSELTTANITKLFDVSSNTAKKYKDVVREEMAKRSVLSNEINSVNTKIAYEVWGLDISDLEKRYAKLQKFKNS